MFRRLCIVFINILFLLIFVFVSNYYAEKYSGQFISFVNKILPSKVEYSESEINKYDIEEFPTDFNFLQWNDENFNKFCGEERIEFGQNYKNKEAIVILGCSYAYGHGISKENSFPYILSQLSKRPVYSFAQCGDSPFSSYQNMMDNINKYPNLKNAKYVIYLYMYDHITRLLNHEEFKKITMFNKKIEGKNLFYKKFFLLDYIHFLIIRKSLLTEKAPRVKTISYLKNALVTLNSMIKSEFPNAKFIVIVYDEKILKSNLIQNIPYVSDILNSDIWYTFPKDITIVKTKDIIGFKFNNNYKIKKDFAGIHPNEKAWKEFTPKFQEQYIK